MCSSTRYWPYLTRPLANSSVLRLPASARKIMTLSSNFFTMTKRTFTCTYGKSKSQKFVFWSHGKSGLVAEVPLYSAKITCVMITEQQGRHRALLPRRRQRRHADWQCSAVPGCAGEISEGPQDKAERYGSPPYSWFQQDVSHPTPPKKTQDWLQERLGEHVISMFETCPWPSSSPDLTPSEFFMWVYLKSHVYRTSSRSLWDLKEAVKSVLGCVPPPCAALRRRPRCAGLNSSS